MKIRLERSYRSKNGNATFVYVVNANAQELEDFKAIQGEYYRENDKGQALWFTTRCVGQTGTLIVTSNGNLVPDMSAFDQAASLAAQYGGNFGQTLAESLVANITGGNSSQPAAQPAPKAEQPANGDGLGDI